MATSLTIAGISTADGMTRIRFSDGSSRSIGSSVIDDFVKDMIAQLDDILPAALIYRAHVIDPTHGVAFRNALIGKTMTADGSQDNMLVRS